MSDWLLITLKKVGLPAYCTLLMRNLYHITCVNWWPRLEL